MPIIFSLIVRRLISAVLTLLIVSVIVFAALEILPGSIATRVLGRDATPVSIAALEAKFGLDQPVLVRYGRWLGGIVQGDLGTSLISGRPIATILAEPLRNTAILSLVALVLYFPISFGVAIAQALARGKALDQALSVATLLLAAIPDFLLATGLLLVFTLYVPAFDGLAQVTPDYSASQYLRAVFLPALTLAIVMAVYAIRMLRDNLIDALESEHVRHATLRGLRPRRAVLGYALPTALIPTINVTALNISYLIGGVVIVEKVFSYPGFGSQTVDAFQLRDVTRIEAAVLIASALFIVVNLVADLVSLAVNPRLRAG